MPYRQEYVEPEVILDHGPVTVYATYDDDLDPVRRDEWFALLEESGEDSDGNFDARELPRYAEFVEFDKPRFLTAENFPNGPESPEYKAEAAKWTAWRADHDQRIVKLLAVSIGNGDLRRLVGEEMWSAAVEAKGEVEYQELPPDQRPATDEQYVAAARAAWHRDGEIEIDDANIKVSRGEDPGAYVQAWIWVPEPDARAIILTE